MREREGGYHHHFSTVMNHPSRVKQDAPPKPWESYVGRYRFLVTVYQVDFILKKALGDVVRRGSREWKDKDKFQPYCEAVIVGKNTFSRETAVWGGTILGVYRVHEALEREYSLRMGKWRHLYFYRNGKDMELIDEKDNEMINPFNFRAFWKETEPDVENWFRWCHEKRGFPNLVFYTLNATKFENKPDKLDIDDEVLANLFPAHRYLRYEEDIYHFIRDYH
jgi:hypothetical protein